MSIIKKNNKFYVVAELGIDPTTKRRKQKWYSGYDTREEAELAEKAMIVDKNRGVWVEPTTTTLYSFMHDIWFPTKQTLQQATRDVYAHFIERIKSHSIGSVPVQKLSPLDIERYKIYLNSLSLSQTSIRHELSTLKGSLKWAVDKGLLVKSPAATLTLPDRSKFKPSVVDAKTMQTLIKIANKKDPQMEMLIRLAGTCGLRNAEVSGLKWKNVDMDNGKLYIEYAYDYADTEETYVDKKGKIKPKRKLGFVDLKTINSDRRVPIMPDTLAALAVLKEKQEAMLAQHEWKNEDDLVNLQIVNGNPCSPDYIDRRFAKFLKKNDLPHMRFHDLRHSYATNLRDAGVPMETISELLGHYDSSFTHKTYAHPSDEIHEKAALALQEKMTPAKNNKIIIKRVKKLSEQH